MPCWTQAIVSLVRRSRSTHSACAGIKQIGPHSTLGFETQLTVPPETPLTDSLVVWWWFGTSDNSAATVKQPMTLIAPKP
jgi:hypothetical protein